jgi:hypothetical protein
VSAGPLVAACGPVMVWAICPRPERGEAKKATIINRIWSVMPKHCGVVAG